VLKPIWFLFPNMALDTVMPVALVFVAWICFADCMFLNSTQGMLEQEHQQLLQIWNRLPEHQTVDPHTPAKGLSPDRFPVLGQLVAEVFDGTVVICYKERCNDHKPGSYLWPPLALNKIVALDGDWVDKLFFQNYTCQDSYVCHFPKTTVSHLMAVKLASDRGWKNVLILEDDIQESGVVSNQAEFITAFKQLLSIRSWNGLKLTGRRCEKELVKHPCPSNCEKSCTPVPEWKDTQELTVGNGTQKLTICQSVVRQYIDYKSALQRGWHDHCKLFSSAAYALHASGFGPFLALLEDVKAAGDLGSPANKNLVDEVLLIDKFVIANVPRMLHVLPLIAVQYEDDQQLATLFRAKCNV